MGSAKGLLDLTDQLQAGSVASCYLGIDVFVLVHQMLYPLL